MICLYLAQYAWGQSHPLQRKVEQLNPGEFTVSYTIHSDSLKGFFLITENLTGKTKLLKTTCKFPYRFENNRLQLSGDKIPQAFKADFTFKMLDDEAKINGHFRSENFGHESLEMTFEEIKLQKREPLLSADHQNLATTDRKQNSGEMYPKVSSKTDSPNRFTASGSSSQPSQRKNEVSSLVNQTSTINNPLSTTKNQPDTVYAISFRVQLAASTTPMDINRLKLLSGLDQPVYEDRIDNYFKYTIGNVTSLQAAQNLLNRVAKNNFKKPFIVAYLDKNRVTVQQALAEINRMNEGAVYRK